MSCTAFRLAVALAATLAISGCAQGARTSAMVAPLDTTNIIQPGSPLSGAIKVGTVTGGEDTYALLMSEVSDQVFRDALEQSLRVNTILGTDTAPMTVDATIQAMEQPLMGLSMTVTSTVNYKVMTTGGAVVFDETITTPYTAAFSDSFLGAERLRLANEGSAKANIAEFIKRLNAATTANASGFMAGRERGSQA